MRKKSILSCAILTSLFFIAAPLQAVIHPLAIFTNNGSYYNSPYLNLYVDMLDAGTGKADFIIHNSSTIDSSIARVYFYGGYDGLLAGISKIN